MKRKTLATLLLILLPCAAQAHDPWTRADTERQALDTGLVVLDWGTTLDIANHPGFHECNPILGRHPSRARINEYISAAIAADALLAYELPAAWRHRWQWAVAAVEVAAVDNNLGMGLRLRF